MIYTGDLPWYFAHFRIKRAYLEGAFLLPSFFTLLSELAPRSTSDIAIAAPPCPSVRGGFLVLVSSFLEFKDLTLLMPPPQLAYPYQVTF